jgi:hypothetical protein
MGAFGKRAAERKAAAVRVKEALARAKEKLESDWKEIETGAKDVLAGIRASLVIEAQEANDDGYEASVADVRLDGPPRVGSQLGFKLGRPDYGSADPTVHRIVVAVELNGQVLISSHQQLGAGEVRVLSDSEKIGTIGEWPFPDRIEAYLNKFIGQVDNR